MRNIRFIRNDYLDQFYEFNILFLVFRKLIYIVKSCKRRSNKLFILSIYIDLYMIFVNQNNYIWLKYKKTSNFINF